MAVLCDYTMIQGDSVVTIGDANPQWTKNFNTSGRLNSNAFLMFNVWGLTHTTNKVEVRINGQRIGDIHPYYPGGSDVDPTDIGSIAKQRQAQHWYTQMIAFPGSVLNNGNNTISILAVTFPGTTSSNTYDDFNLKDVMCFFKQSS